MDNCESKMIVSRASDEESSVNGSYDQYESRSLYLQLHSKKSINFISKCFDQQMEVRNEIPVNYLSKLESSSIALNRTLSKATELSFEFDRYKESKVKQNSKSLLRYLDPFGDIPHTEFIHGLSRSIDGGSLHVIYQLLISIEKSILVPVTLTNLSFKSLLDSYGKFPIDLSDFESEMRGIKTLFQFKSIKSSRHLSVGESLFQDFEDLLFLKIGVPSFFQFTVKQFYTCSSCIVTSKSIKSCTKYFLKLNGNHIGRDSSISEMLR
jgi:hypothetical protein